MRWTSKCFDNVRGGCLCRKADGVGENLAIRQILVGRIYSETRVQLKVQFSFLTQVISTVSQHNQNYSVSSVNYYISISTSPSRPVSHGVFYKMNIGSNAILSQTPSTSCTLGRRGGSVKREYGLAHRVVQGAKVVRQGRMWRTVEIETPAGTGSEKTAVKNDRNRVDSELYELT